MADFIDRTFSKLKIISNDVFFNNKDEIIKDLCVNLASGLDKEDCSVPVHDNDLLMLVPAGHIFGFFKVGNAKIIWFLEDDILSGSVIVTARFLDRRNNNATNGDQ